MKRIRILSLSIVCLLLVSCYENDDKYNAGKELKITGGFEKVYNKTAVVDVLHIDPQIYTTDVDAELSYRWRLWLDYSGTQVPQNIEVKTISEERELKYLVVDKPQTYRVEFKVTNHTTGQEAYAYATLNVGNEFSNGFYVLKESGGMTEIDLHKHDGTYMADLMKTIQGQSLSGTPRSLSVLPKYCYIDHSMAEKITTTLNVATTEGFYMLDVADLNVLRDLNSMFLLSQNDVGESFLTTFIYFGATFLSSRGVYYTTYDVVWGSGGNGIFGNPIAIAGGYQPNININADCYYTYFFDELNGRFLTIDYNGTLYACSNQNAAGVTPDVTPNDIPHTLLYFGRNKMGSNTATGIIVMQDENNAATRHLYEMTLNGLRSNPMLSTHAVTGLKLNEATLFANNEIQSRVLYYAAGNEVYTYLFDDQKEQKLTLSDFGSGETITYLKNIYWTNASTDDGKFNYLAIGTQNGSNYKVYLYTLFAGVPMGAPQILQGEGKAIKIQYVTPEFTYNIGNYQYPLGY